MRRLAPCLALGFALLPACGSSAREDRTDGPRASTAPLPTSWHLPQVDPCAMLSRTAVEALVGSPVGEGGPGGTAVDGSACRYVGAGPFVISIGFMSTNAYESLEIDFGGEPMPDVGASAVVDGPDQLGDVVLAARGPEAAVLIQISGVIPGGAGPAKRALAANLARRALEQLKHVVIASRRTRHQRTSEPSVPRS